MTGRAIILDRLRKRYGKIVTSTGLAPTFPPGRSSASGAERLG
jgi:hypothetical protein